jgi:CelD/BcsL family acetyltransferase involved in cellulose biosynthesis
MRLKSPEIPWVGVTVRIALSFDDPLVAPERWNRLLDRGCTNSVNLTYEWQRNWWEAFGRGELLLIVVEQDGHPICIAPLFADHGMIFNICPEDQLDFIGRAPGTHAMEAILECMLDRVPDFQGLRLYFVPQSSPTNESLRIVADHLGLVCFEENAFSSPRLDLTAEPALAISKTRKKSLLRHENHFRRTGQLSVRHTSSEAEILPQLDEFFSQHIARRSATHAPSLFVEPRQREYYRSIVTKIGPKGWLRFTRIEWNSRAIAFHFGLSYRGRYLFGIPSFDIELARHSPGEVLLRQLMLDAIDEKATTFDFGIGDEAYKYRFATSEERLVTWGVYPRSLCQREGPQCISSW